MLPNNLPSNAGNNARDSFDHFLTTALNEQQLKAVVERNGVLLVCAGAGSGKTRVITARMTNLILNHAVAAHQLIALTFTNKAAREMKERIAHFLPGEHLPYVGTFHSYCLRLLKTHRHLISIPEFSILDTSDQEKLVKTLITRHGLQKKITAKTVLHTIGRLKNEAHTGSIDFHSIQDPLIQQMIYSYEHEKRVARCFDFDDLLLETLQLLRKNASFKKQYQETIRHILIDEYQDTNRVQHALLKELTQDNNTFVLDSLCVVGDEDQSIYSWRGATVSNIINFKRDFPQALYITIEQNYRSVHTILESANAVIAHNQQRNPKKLWSARAGSDRVRILACMSNYQEGDALAALAQQVQRTSSLATMAILYRSHYQSRTIEEALIKQSIPYKIIGGIQFYERQEIKDLLAYMRLVVNPYDRVSFMRVINVPQRGLGDKFEEQFLSRWETQPFASCSDIAQLLLQEQAITKSKQEALQEFLQVFSQLNATDKAYTVVDTIIKNAQYFTYIKNSFEPEEAQAKLENIKELLYAITALEESKTITTVTDFLNEVALLQDQIAAPEEERDCVTLMTLHAAKGLEFDTVAVTGLEEGILPSGHNLHQEESLEEERRLLYVGMTRARERLLLTHARYRHVFGSLNDQRVSRFIHEIPTTVVQQDISQWHMPTLTTYIQQWFSSRHIPASKPGAQPSQEWLKDPFTPAVTSTKKEWHQRQKVHHAQFGSGIVEHIDRRADNKVILTIRFAAGIKKLDASFLQ